MAAPTPLLRGFEKKVVTAQPKGGKRTVIFDESTTGLCVIVSPRGRKTFTVVARNPLGKQVWASLGTTENLDVSQAREQAREAVSRIKQGLAALADTGKRQGPETFASVADAWLARHVRREGQGVPALRSAPAIERQFRDLIGPEWNALPFADIKRHHVAKLRDKIAAERGPVMADRVLASLSTLFRQQRDHMPDDWHPPEVQRLTKGSERARSRVLFDVRLDDDPVRAGRDLRLLWTAASEAGAFGAMIKLLLLTAQRRAKVAAMKWADIDLDKGTWNIPSEAREKGNAELLRLPDVALQIIKDRPRVGQNPYVFAGRGAAHLSGFSPLKAEVDQKIAALNEGTPLEPWTLHDLRRTAKTLMSRAGVQPHVSERVLGHALGALEKVYEHYNWADAKGKALAKLAKQIEAIVSPPTGNVVGLNRGVA